jgi:hypothetical protein
MTVKAYCTPAELRTQIEKTGSTGPATDVALTVLIKGASQLIDGYFSVQTGFFIADTIAVARLFPGSGKSVQRIDECVAITEVAVKDSPETATYTVWALTDYIAYTGAADNPDFNSLPKDWLMILPTGDYSSFTSGAYSAWQGFPTHVDDVFPRQRKVPTVRVTANWGYSVDVPDAVKEATIAISARWFKRGQSSWADAVAAGEMGQLLYNSAEFADIKIMLNTMRVYHPPTG